MSVTKSVWYYLENSNGSVIGSYCDYVKMIKGSKRHMLAITSDTERVKSRLDYGSVMWGQKGRSGSF